MTDHCDNSLMSTIFNIDATYFFDDENLNPTIVKKQVSSYIVFDTIRNSIMGQFEYTFGIMPDVKVLKTLVNGFILFNLHKNAFMVKSKEALLKYVEDKSISIEERQYFLDIFLYNRRPKFLTIDEHEYLRMN